MFRATFRFVFAAACLCTACQGGGTSGTGVESGGIMTADSGTASNGAAGTAPTMPICGTASGVNGEPLAGLIISSLDAATRTETDQSGYFTIDLPVESSGEAVLVVSAIEGERELRFDPSENGRSVFLLGDTGQLQMSNCEPEEIQLPAQQSSQ